MAKDFKIGDAITAPSNHGPRYEGVIVQHERYGQKGTVCAYINWDGDCVYVDYHPDDLEPKDWTKLSSYFREFCIKLRQKIYLKGDS